MKHNTLGDYVTASSLFSIFQDIQNMSIYTVRIAIHHFHKARLLVLIAIQNDLDQCYTNEIQCEPHI